MRTCTLALVKKLPNTKLKPSTQRKVASPPFWATFLNNEAYADVYTREQEYARTRAYVDYAFHFSTANEEHITRVGRLRQDLWRDVVQIFHEFQG
jgi:hypothetical protein